MVCTFEFLYCFGTGGNVALQFALKARTQLHSVFFFHVHCAWAIATKNNKNVFIEVPALMHHLVLAADVLTSFQLSFEETLHVAHLLSLSLDLLLVFSLLQLHCSSLCRSTSHLALQFVQLGLHHTHIVWGFMLILTSSWGYNIKLKRNEKNVSIKDQTYGAYRFKGGGKNLWPTVEPQEAAQCWTQTCSQSVMIVPVAPGCGSWTTSSWSPEPGSRQLGRRSAEAVTAPHGGRFPAHP